MKALLLTIALLALSQLRSFSPAPGYEIAYVDFKGVRKPIATVPDTVFAPRISPNGKQLTIDTDIGSDSAIYLMDLPGPSTMRRFTMQDENHYPIWPADGLRILFISVRNGQPAIPFRLQSMVSFKDRETIAGSTTLRRMGSSSS